MRSPLVIPSPGNSTLPVFVSATVSRPTFTCSRVGVLATLRNLPDHVGRALVPAQSLEPGVAQLPGRGPFAEADLRDHPGPGPVHPGPGRVPPAERAPLLLQRGQLVVEPAQGLLVEPCPHLARVDELPVAVVDAEQQRTEAGAAALRIGVPTDHELLVVLALELQPVLGPAARIWGVGPFGDEPFPALLARLSVELDPVADPVLGEAQRVGEVQQLVQPLL